MLELAPEGASPLYLTYQHWAGVSPYTSHCCFAGTCVFDKQSTDKLWLRSHCWDNPSPEVTGSLFAEFLKLLSLAHLSLLDQPTCVGLRYGLIELSLRTFSRKLNKLGLPCFRRTLHRGLIKHIPRFATEHYFARLYQASLLALTILSRQSPIINDLNQIAEF